MGSNVEYYEISTSTATGVDNNNNNSGGGVAPDYLCTDFTIDLSAFSSAGGMGVSGAEGECV